ncbi:MAG: hypothetical protein KF716_19520 [Anaerolineae bacterium]|nr:hypothetical protein [Anaerolineae bacterium]
MSNRPDDFNFGDEYDAEDTPTGGSTRPQQIPEQPRRSTGSTPARRPTDDIPTNYSRPSLSAADDVPRRTASTRATGTSASVPPPPRATPRKPLPEPNTNIPGRVRRTQTMSKRENGLYLPWWSLLVLIIFVGAAAVGAWAVVGYLGGNFAPGGETPMVIVITSTYTVGPPATPTDIPGVPTLTPAPALPTIPPTGTTPPGQFQVGATVTVVGVGEAGLNVRSSPGVDGAIKFRALDGETYTLREQPQFASNIEWWFIQSADDTTRSGWAARQYLEVSSAQP